MVVRHFARHGLEPYHAEDMLTREHGGGFSLDASVRVEATDRTGLERLIRYCARPPFALERLHLVVVGSDQVLDLLPKPDPAGRTAILPPPRIHRHRYHGVFSPKCPLETSRHGQRLPTLPVGRSPGSGL